MPGSINRLFCARRANRSGSNSLEQIDQVQTLYSKLIRFKFSREGGIRERLGRDALGQSIQAFTVKM